MDTLRMIQRFYHRFYVPQFVVMRLGVLEQEALRVEPTTATSAAEVNEKLHIVLGEGVISWPLRVTLP
jgi:hypothetical protein